MKYADIELDQEEKQILKDFEQGKFKSVPNLKREQQRYKAYAKSMLNKTRNINIRMSESDLIAIKTLAFQKGIPYQTMLTSLIHQYSSGQLKETSKV